MKSLPVIAGNEKETGGNKQYFQKGYFW